MAQRGADSITLVDLTDGVSVVLSSEAYAFPGSTSAALAGSTTTKIQALVGSEYVAASVNVANITKPANVTVTSDGHATAPTLTISVTTAVTTGGTVVIPVQVGDVTIEKRFNFTIAYKGATGATGGTGAQGPKGDTGNPGTNAVTVGLKNEAHTIVTNNSGSTTSASTIQVDFYAYVGSSRVAATAAVMGTPTGITVGTNSAADSTKDGVLTLSVANGSTLGGTDSGTITVTITVNGVGYPKVFTWSKAKTGAQGSTGSTGPAGADAVTVEVSSSAGLIFKNTQVATVLTARVYKGGVEQTVASGGVVAGGLGTVKWYKNATYLTGKDGQTLTVSPGDVDSQATYEARLEY